MLEAFKVMMMMMMMMIVPYISVIGTHSLSSGGAAAANAGIPDRLFKR